VKRQFRLQLSSVLFCLTLFPGLLAAQSFLSRTSTNVESAAKQHVGTETVSDTAAGSDRHTESGSTVLKDNQLKMNETLVQPQAVEDERPVEVGDAPTVAAEEDPAGAIAGLLQQISARIDNGEYGHAKALLEGSDWSVLNELTADEKFKNGEMYLFLLMKTSFLLGDYQTVIQTAPSYFAAYGNGTHYYLSYYYFAVALDHLKQPLQMVYLVTDDFFDNLSRRESRKLRQLLIKDALNTEQPLVAYHFMLDSDGSLINGFDLDISAVIKRIEDINDIEVIIEEGPEASVKSLAQLRKVQLLIRDGAYRAAREFINLLFTTENLEAATLSELQGLRSYVDIALNTDPYRIGVILPISHSSFGHYARQVLDGLELSLQAQSTSERKIQLVIKDSAATANDDEKESKLFGKERETLVQQQVRELIEKERVIAILGPLAKNTSLAAGEAAEHYKVPVISFSITEELGKGMPFLFRFQRNRIAEAENLARYALDYLGAERFVLFYTVDSAGKGYRIMQAFQQVIEERGATIVGISPVNYNQVDFNNNYLSITGGFKKSLDLEENVKKEEEEDPVIDFDLMYAPVPLHTLKIMLDFNRSFDAEMAWVLAGADINVRENQLLSYPGRLRFIDAFPIGSTGTYLQPFYEEHWRSYNFRSDYQPPTSYTIYGYEALEILGKLLDDPRYHNRESLRNAIQQLDEFPILTGRVSSDRNGELVKQLTILKIQARKTVAVY